MATPTSMVQLPMQSRYGLCKTTLKVDLHGIHLPGGISISQGVLSLGFHCNRNVKTSDKERMSRPVIKRLCFYLWHDFRWGTVELNPGLLDIRMGKQSAQRQHFFQEDIFFCFQDYWIHTHLTPRILSSLHSRPFDLWFPFANIVQFRYMCIMMNTYILKIKTCSHLWYTVVILLSLWSNRRIFAHFDHSLSLLSFLIHTQEA